MHDKKLDILIVQDKEPLRIWSYLPKGIQVIQTLKNVRNRLNLILSIMTNGWNRQKQDLYQGREGDD